MGYSFLLSPVLTCVVNKLCDYLVGKIIEHHDLKDDVECLQTFLNKACHVFRNAESDFSLLDIDDEFMDSMSDIRKEVIAVEDALDTFTCNFEKITREQAEPKTVVEDSFFRPSELLEVNELSKRIKSINKKLHAISKNNSFFNFTKPEYKKSERRYKRICNLRKQNLKMECRDIFGFTKEKEKIQKLLHNNEEKRLVIAIVGMGGSGKTAIGRHFYHAEKKKGLFEVYACVNVCKTDSSDEEQCDDFLKAVRTSLNITDCSDTDDQDKPDEIIGFLSKKKYLIFLDDVWDTDMWDMVSRYIPESNNGSRLLITTRSMRVARYSNSAFVELDNLDVPYHEQLLKTVHCKDFDTEELKDELSSMLKLCYGLPLAIIELGKMLSRRGRHNWWEVKKCDGNESNKVKGIKWNLDSNTINCLEIIGLSYNDLKPEWKFCFLYFSAFSKNSKIDVNKLLRLWIAEGFILPEKGTALESIARRYLNELIDRNMVQPMDGTSEIVKTVKMHGMLLDLCNLKANNILLDILDGGKIGIKRKTVRRIALYKCENIEEYFDGDSAIHLRTLLCFVPFNYDFRKFKLLSILHMSGQCINEFSDRVIDLIQLRYLGLDGRCRFTLHPPIADLTSSKKLDAKCNFLSTLQTAYLPYLHTLYLENVTDIREINFSNKSFPKLEVLILKSLDKLESLLVWDGAMSSLICLNLKRCCALEMICLEKGALKKLRRLEVDDCNQLKIPSELLNRLNLEIVVSKDESSRLI